MTAFTAHFSYADTQGNSFKAGLSDDEFDTSRYVLFERLKRPDEQDKKFGFEAPYLEIDDQGKSGYALVERVELAPTNLKIWFSEQGRRSLQATDVLQVNLGSSLNVESFKSAMSEILGDRFIVVAN
jgi:hypothetical protein